MHSDTTYCSPITVGSDSELASIAVRVSVIPHGSSPTLAISLVINLREVHSCRIKQAQRVSIVDRIVLGICVPVIAIPNRVLREEPPDTRVIVAVPHQHQARVRVHLTTVRPAKAERRTAAACRRHAPKPVEVDVLKLVLRGAIQRLQVAEAVEAVVVADPAPVLAKAGRVEGMAVGQHGSTGCSAVADVSVSAGAVRFAYSEAQAVVGVGVGRAPRHRQPTHAVFVVAVAEYVAADAHASCVAVFNPEASAGTSNDFITALQSIKYSTHQPNC